VHDQFHPSRHFHISLVKRESLIFLLDERTHGSEREESSCVCVCECYLVLSSREREKERERKLKYIKVCEWHVIAVGVQLNYYFIKQVSLHSG
jgi:hypothetical protein